MNESNIDARERCNLLFGQKAMLLTFIGVATDCIIGLGLAFILSRTMPLLPRNNAYRFVFLFAFCVPLNFVVNYVHVAFWGWHKMGWAGALIIACLLAVVFITVSETQPANSNTPRGSKSR
jgi:hypothetical protein